MDLKYITKKIVTFATVATLALGGGSLEGCVSNYHVQNKRVVSENSEYHETIEQLRANGINIQEEYSFENPESDRIIIFSPDIHIKKEQIKQNKRLEFVLNNFSIDAVGLEGLSGGLSETMTKDTHDDSLFGREEYTKGRKMMASYVKKRFEEIQDIEERLAVDGKISGKYIFPINEIILGLSSSLSHIKYNYLAPGNAYFKKTYNLFESSIDNKTRSTWLEIYGLEDKEMYQCLSQGIVHFNAVARSLGLMGISVKLSDLKYDIHPKQEKIYKAITDYERLIEELRDDNSSLKEQSTKCEEEISNEKLEKTLEREKIWIKHTNKQEGKLFYVIGGEDHITRLYETAESELEGSLIILESINPKIKEEMCEEFKKRFPETNPKEICK